MMTTELLRPLLKEPTAEQARFLVIQYIMYTHTLVHTVQHLQDKQKNNQSKKSHEWTY